MSKFYNGDFIHDNFCIQSNLWITTTPGPQSSVNCVDKLFMFRGITLIIKSSKTDTDMMVVVGKPLLFLGLIVHIAWKNDVEELEWSICYENKWMKKN